MDYNSSDSADSRRLEGIEAYVCGGKAVSREDALFLAGLSDIDALCDAADCIRRMFAGNAVDSCSIVNARSGLCSEDCKWCSQASRHHTGCDVYDYIGEAELMEAARRNQEAGIHRFSLVTSGKAVPKKDMPRFCEMFRGCPMRPVCIFVPRWGLSGLKR